MVSHFQGQENRAHKLEAATSLLETGVSVAAEVVVAEEALSALAFPLSFYVGTTAFKHKAI